MRPTRRMLPRVSFKLLLITFLFLFVSFAAYIGFAEKHPLRSFGFFHPATRVPQMNIQQHAQRAVASHQERVKRLKVILSPDNIAQEQAAVKRLALNNNLDAKEQHAKEGGRASASIEQQTRDSFVVPADNKKQAVEELRLQANEMQAKSRAGTPVTDQNLGKGATPPANQKQDWSIAPISSSKEEKNKDVMPDHKRGKQSEATYMAPPSATNQTKGLLKEADTSEQHLVTSDPLSMKLSAKEKSVSVADSHNASAPGARQGTHTISSAIHNTRFKASDFKSEPHWDFDDQYLLDNVTSQSTCPNSLRVKSAKSDWLQGIFLPNITIFMDRSHFSDSEWERMEHFPPPFGFMELNYSLVKEVITMLPPKPYHQILMAHSSQASRCITCAVVGNGGILNNSRMGPVIDSHDYVFRVSGAVIKGYEKDVGTRTSFYGFTAYSLMSSLMILGDHGFNKIPMGTEIKYLHFLEGERDYEWLKALLLNKDVRKGFLDYYGKKPRDRFDDFSLDKYFVIHPDFLRYTKNRFLKSKSLDKPYWRLYRPTTGAFVLLTALHLCDQVSAYGYITEGYQKYSDHYYDKEWKRLIFYLNHDFDLERRVWEKLHNANIMKLYHRS
ncbi:alpha-N-acetylgalactosaminide alpha-2,6-sialyltransferase 1 [Heteronotia binoei]|uniref:alpha-N-acetylgalactosaminide alpha-2,6-sialyltransferase 1 n=1 Tax=Heteronotia binoei TaxID=13085 RepID=UPI00292F0B7C|nr:alpha-N-acetylgalactosaminide alpha-2,6-sialyltransferase 1 [Heteronotia binoei]